MTVSDAGSPSGNGASGAGAGNPGSGGDAGNVVSLVNETINKAMSPWIRRLEQREKAIEETLARLTASAAEKPQETLPATSPSEAGNPADPEKVTQKARIEALEKQLQAFQKQAQDADSRARDAAMRARVQAEVAKYLPANDPNHAAYMGMLYDLQKRFVEEGGNPAVKFKREWGDEAVPLEAGVKELFDGELKHLVQHSKANSLPHAGRRGTTGQVMTQPKPGPKFNPLLAEVAKSIGEVRPEFGHALMDAANGTNGTPSKP